MTSKQAAERFSDMYGATVSKLVWIAADPDSRDLKDMLQDDMDDKDFKECFPDIVASKHFDSYKKDLLSAMVDFDKYGLLAEVHYAEPSNFRYDKKGNPVSWSSSGGISRIGFAYADSLDGLVDAIEKQGEKIFNEHVRKDKAKKKSNKLV